MNPTITITLDEDYPFHLEDKWGYLRADARLEIPVWGEVTIEYHDTDYWWIKELEIGASNCKSGQDSKGWEQTVYSTHPLWAPIEKYLKQIRGDEVAQLIRDDISSRVESYLFDEGKERAKLRGVA